MINMIKYLIISVLLFFSSCTNKDKNSENSINILKQSIELIKTQNNSIIEFAENQYDSSLLDLVKNYQTEIDSLITKVKDEKASISDINTFIEKREIYTNENLILPETLNYNNQIQINSILLYLELLKNKVLNFFQKSYYKHIFKFKYISPVVVVDNNKSLATIYVAGANDNAMFAVIEDDTIFMNEKKKLEFSFEKNTIPGAYEKNGKLFLLKQNVAQKEEYIMDFSFTYIVN